jgi:Fe2+ or Zn2+ uptake regulation protein
MKGARVGESLMITTVWRRLVMYRTAEIAEKHNEEGTSRYYKKNPTHKATFCAQTLIEEFSESLRRQGIQSQT